MGIIVLAFGYHLSKDLYYKKEPSITESEEYIDSPDKFLMNKTSKTIGIGLQNRRFEDIHFIDDTIYHVKVRKIYLLLLYIFFNFKIF